MVSQMMLKKLKIWIIILWLSCGSYLNFVPSLAITTKKNCSGPAPNLTNSSTYNGTQYLYFQNEKVNHYQASCGCSLWNATLASIKNNATQNHIVENMPLDYNCSGRSAYYIGLFLHPDNVWRWPDNESLHDTGFMNWRRLDSKNSSSCYNEPNGYRNCTSQPRLANATQISSCINESRAKLGEWFDKNQNTSKWYFICQRPYEVPTEEQTTQPNLSTTKQVPSSTQSTSTVTTMFSTVSTTVQTTAETTVTSTPFSTYPTTTKSPTTFTLTNFSKTNKTIAVSSTMSSAERNRLRGNQDCRGGIILYPETNEIKIDCVSYKFGKDFTIAEWETKISFKFAKALFLHNKTELLVYSISGIKIRLHKIDSLDKLYQHFEKVNEMDSTFLIDFNQSSSSRFQLKVKTFENFSFPFVIVSALFENQLWSYSDLAFASPLHPINNVKRKSNLGLNYNYEFLPSNEGLLSFSAFVKLNETEVKKKSVPISHYIEVPLDSTEELSISALDRNSNQRIALNGIEYRCGFVDVKANNSWLTNGCQFVSQEKGVVRCECNHTTTFGVFLALRGFEIPPVVTRLVIGLEVITIIALTATVTLLLWLKRSMNNDRTIVQINLASSLLILHLFFLLSDYARNKPYLALCQSCAVLAQYFTLTTGFWMLNEGIVLYFKTYKNALSFNLKKVFPILAAVAWGFPFIYVALCASIGISKNIYMDNKTSVQFFSVPFDNNSVKYNTCYVGFLSGMIYSVVVPLAIILIITLAIVIKTSVKINAINAKLSQMKPSGRVIPVIKKDDATLVKPKRQISLTLSQKNILRQASAALRAMVLLLPVLGVTWFLGFLVNIPKAEVAFVIIHGIINGLQGVFIFYIYCVKNSHFRRVFNRKWKELSTNFIGTDYNSNRFSRAATHKHSYHNGENFQKSTQK